MLTAIAIATTLVLFGTAIAVPLLVAVVTARVVGYAG